jgi:hypothetical protein
MQSDVLSRLRAVQTLACTLLSQQANREEIWFMHRFESDRPLSTRRDSDSSRDIPYRLYILLVLSGAVGYSILSKLLSLTVTPSSRYRGTAIASEELKEIIDETYTNLWLANSNLGRHCCGAQQTPIAASAGIRHPQV